MRDKTIRYLGLPLLLLFLISFNSCSTNSTSAPGPESQKLNDAFRQASSFPELKSLIVARNGVIIKEQYFNGGGADLPSDVRSVTKSVTSLLIGIAIDKGLITSTGQTISEYISPLVNNFSAGDSAITINDLLTMSGGFKWDELGNVNEYINWFAAPNQVQYLIDRPLVAQPGQVFNYNSAAAHLLSVILTKATGMRTRDFAQKYLFEPLGTSVTSWETDKQGYTNGAAGMFITPHDMIKIGMLILNGGTYNGKRIVSQEWIEQSIARHIGTFNAQMFGPGYGYCWWAGQNNNLIYAFANGYGGQFIVVVPELNLVVTATNNWSGLSDPAANNDWAETLTLIMNSIVPAFN
jgi:CubicO group peptidase (beta-lactamase class C family)